MSELTRTLIDRLGERLRADNSITADDRILLDEYRRSLASFSNTITTRLQRLLDRPITERPGKTTPSIIAKLKRQPIALSRMQDVAGGRVVVDDLPSQDTASATVLEAFPEARLVDRRKSPIVGYHAVHFVIREGPRSYELQIRTEAQQRWAQLSEKFADLLGFEIKYGGGPEAFSRQLTATGGMIYSIERLKKSLSQLLELDEKVKTLPNYQSQIDREKIAADVAAADVNLQGGFSGLERVIELLKKAETI
jgi:ppGpp synthetase/RelA/SpoT-type nucleotidyltranferase